MLDDMVVVPENVSVVGADGLIQGVEPVPVAVIAGREQVTAAPVMLIDEVAGPAPDGVNRIYRLLDTVDPLEKLYDGAHEELSEDTSKSILDEVTVSVPGVRPVPASA